MSLFNRKPITGADGMDLVRATAGKKWSEALRILEGSTIDQQSLDNALLMAVLSEKHKVLTALLGAGASPDAMNGRAFREAALNADTRSMRILFQHQPALARFAAQIRNDVYARWADVPGGDGSVYQDTIKLLDRMIENKTAMLARAKRRTGKKPPTPGSV